MSQSPPQTHNESVKTRSRTKQERKDATVGDYKLNGSTLAYITGAVIGGLVDTHHLNVDNVQNKGHSHRFNLYDGKMQVKIKKKSFSNDMYSPPARQRMIEVESKFDNNMHHRYAIIYSMDKNVIISPEFVAQQILKSDIFTPPPQKTDPADIVDDVKAYSSDDGGNNDNSCDVSDHDTISVTAGNKNRKDYLAYMSAVMALFIIAILWKFGGDDFTHMMNFMHEM